MKSLTLTFALFSLISCSKNLASSPLLPKPLEERKETNPVLSCDHNTGPFACLAKACEAAGAHFNTTTNVCECPSGEIFYAGAGGICKSPFNVIDDGALTYQYIYKKNLEFYIQSMTEELSKAEFDQLVTTISIPVYPGKIILNLYANKSEIVGPALKDGFNLSSPLTELTGKDINAGVSRAQLNESRQSLFIPNKNFNLENFKKIGSIREILLNHDLFSLTFDFSKSQVVYYSEKKCAEICYETNRIALDETYDVERFQTISGGNPFETGYRLYAKNSAQPLAYIVTHQDYISHFYIVKKDQSIDVISNRDELIKTLPAPTQIALENRNKISSALPIAIFESDYHQSADSVALTGPYTNQTYFGWFKNNEKPFFYGRASSLYGEEDLTSFEHSYKVSQLASHNFSTPLILMPPRALIYTDMLTVQKRFARPIIASLSLAYTMTQKICENGQLSHSIKNSKNTILWIVGAGNSGRNENKNLLEMCPQSLNTENLILVASTSYNRNTLSRETSYGETFADIALSGCEFKDNDPNPTCSVGGTSYAAPRLAQMIRELSLKNPHKKFGELKLALMFTAFYENSPLPLKSGGIVQMEDAHRFLASFSDVNLEKAFEESKHNNNSESQRQILKSLLDIYKNRFFWKREDLAKKQIERIQKYF